MYTLEKGISTLNLRADISLRIQLDMDLKEMRPCVLLPWRDVRLRRNEFVWKYNKTNECKCNALYTCTFQARIVRAEIGHLKGYMNTSENLKTGQNAQVRETKLPSI